MICIPNLDAPLAKWTVKAVPLVTLMGFEKRRGEMKAVIQKTRVDVKGSSYRAWAALKERVALEDLYLYPEAPSWEETLCRQR
jgi:hypothetical protein